MEGWRLLAAGLVLGLLLGGIAVGAYMWRLLGEERAREELLGRQLAQARARERELEGRVESLQGELEEARGRISALEGLLEERNRTIRELEEQLGDLRAELALKNTTIMTLREKVEKLQAELENKTREVKQLQSELYELEQEKSRLQRKLDAVKEAIQRVIDTWYLRGDPRIPDYILNIAPSTVEEEAQELLEGAGGTGRRVLLVERYILLNTTYASDSYVRLFDGEAVERLHDYIMLPNETLERGGGDCDDLALLAYALLRAYPLQGEKVYIIVWYPLLGPGHAAVLVAAPGGYYIVDPAGNYVDGWGIYLEMRAEDYSSGLDWYIYPSPLEMAPRLKKWLLTWDMARVEYYNYTTETDTYALQSVRAFPTPYRALTAWISEYWGYSTVYIELHAPGVHKKFTSIPEAAAWLAANT